MNVVVTRGAQEMFTPRELTAAYKDFTKREHYYLNAESGLKAIAYRFGTRMLIVYSEHHGDTGQFHPIRTEKSHEDPA
jgi:hypothetical protein